VTVRPATTADREALRELYAEFFELSPPPPYSGATLEDELAEVDEILESHVAAIAEEEDRPVGFALARRKRGAEGQITDLYVRSEARRQGVAAALTRNVTEALREAGATHVTLYVDAGNSDARAVYGRWGFREQVRKLVVEAEALEARLSAEGRGASFGSIHVQTDDIVAVERAVRQFVPRLPGGSRGSVVSQPRHGWISVHDELCDRDPRMLRRLAREISDRMGAVVLALGVEDGEVLHYDLMERGRVVDEYLSVPEYEGPRPPGEIVSLAANPRLLARLTGADPERIRAVARTAATPAELPPATELLAELAATLGLDGGAYGYAEAREAEGAIEILPR
jgi:ribosomal protein S18 acetylase RimI-like enzyme